MTALLEVRDVTVRFGGLVALEAVSLELWKHAVVGLVGPNGAGKTTLFNVISGLQEPDEGAVLLDGEDVTSLPPERRAARGLGRSFQNLGLLEEETVTTNVMSGQHLTLDYRTWDVLLRPGRWWAAERAVRERTAEALRTFGLDDVADQPVGGLSFGAARFVELAALTARHPRILLLDEPTTGLDVAETEQLAQVLRELRDDGIGILVVAHNTRFVMEVCEHVHVLAQGRWLASGPPEEVQRDPAVVEAYLGQAA